MNASTLSRASQPVTRRAVSLRALRVTHHRHNSSLPATQGPNASSNELGIPTQPTWSVTDLLSSYPSPKLSDETFTHIHKLSALKAPASSDPEHGRLKTELEGLIRLVEAVKLSDADLEQGNGEIPDGRIWKKGSGLRFAEPGEPASEEARGRNLLKHAQRTFNGYYEVDSSRTR